MTVSEVLAGTWLALRKDVQALPGVYERRVFAHSRFSIHVGVSQPTGVSLLVLIVSRRAMAGRLEIETRGFKLSVEAASEPGHVRVRLEETHRSFSDLFSQLCVDVVTAVLAAADERQAVDALRVRVEHWQRFMERAGEGLSASRQLGLYGELCFLRALIRAGCSPAKAMDGWRGPLAANHDFMYGRVAVEIKSTASNVASRVPIANERQLDDTGTEVLLLCHQSFDRREHTENTLPALVEEVSRMVGDALIPVFEDRLLLAGYHRSQAGLYSDVGYTSRGCNYYRISEAFPRIVPRDLRSGVYDVQYWIDLSGATDCMVPDAIALGTIG